MLSDCVGTPPIQYVSQHGKKVRSYPALASLKNVSEQPESTSWLKLPCPQKVGYTGFAVDRMKPSTMPEPPPQSPSSTEKPCRDAFMAPKGREAAPKLLEKLQLPNMVSACSPPGRRTDHVTSSPLPFAASSKRCSSVLASENDQKILNLRSGPS